MKILGKGWQYTVYENGDKQVFKKYHNNLLSYFQIIRYSYNYPNFSILNIVKASRHMKEKAVLSIQFIKSKNIDKSLLANPIFINDLDYEQDKVVPFEKIFVSISFDQGKHIIDNFIIFNKKIISLGFIDKSFNISKNFGISSDGNVVLIDIGELFFEKEQIMEQIINKAWNKRYVLEGLPSNELQKYFVTQMEKDITVELLF